MTKTFVIAGTREEAQEWIKRDLAKRYPNNTSLTLSDYVYIDSVDRIRGISNPHGMFVGNWLGRPDILEIVEGLLSASTHPNKALGKIYGDLLPKVRPTPKRFVGKGLNQPQAIEQAANDLAKHIDQHLLEEFTRRINGGILSKSSQAIKDIYSD